MIDKNGKIGGKVNLIDLLILIVIIAVAAFVAHRFLVRDSAGLVKNDAVRLEFTATEVKKYTAAALKEGAPALDADENNYLGSVLSYELGEAYEYIVDEHGDTVELNPFDSVSVVVTTETSGNLDGNGVVINGTRYAVGHSMVLFAGDAKLWVRVSGITPVD